jgi:hypothetical protein
MTPRLLPLLILALFAAPAQAADAKPKKTERTWAFLIEHTMTHGAEDSINAPASRTMGYDSDKVAAKGLYLDQNDSTDGKEHTIAIVYETVEGKPKPKEIVLGRIKFVEKDKIQEISGNRFRLSLDGAPIRGMGAEGIVGHVKQRPLSPGDSEAKKFLSDEKKFWLKQIDLAKLKNDF